MNPRFCCLNLAIPLTVLALSGCIYVPESVSSGSLSDSGSIIGRVMSDRGASSFQNKSSASSSLEWALVQVSQDGKVVADDVTDEDGNYQISNLPQGNYDLSISSDCHKKKNVDEIGVVAGYTLSEDATLAANSNASNGSPAFLPDDPKRPVEQISRDLGIQPDQFRACFKSVRPSGPGVRPTSDRVHANKSVLLPCLQKANSQITNELLDQVMDRYRPGGHEGQVPLE